MLNAIIEKNDNTLFLEFPCKRHVMAEHLASIGITKKAHEISCGDNGDEQIKVRIYGESEFEKKLASFVSPTDTLSLVNTTCEIYQNMPYQNKLDAMDAVLNDKVSSIAEFDKFMLESRIQDTTNHYYCPLVANLYTKDEYGDMDEYPEEYDGSYLPPYEERIREIIKQEDSLDESNLAEYFDGSNGAVGKLKEVTLALKTLTEHSMDVFELNSPSRSLMKKKRNSKNGLKANAQMDMVKGLNNVQSKWKMVIFLSASGMVVMITSF